MRQVTSHVTNPTNIQKIFKLNISFEVFDDSHSKRSFIIHELFLNNLDLPGNAHVYCVPRVRDVEKPVSLGQVNNLKNIGTMLPIEGLSSNAPLTFRFLVVDYDTSMILASAENLRARSPNDDGLEALLPVDCIDLGNLIWRMSLDLDGGPVLELNNNYPSIREKLRTDVEYQALIIPEAVRQVLIRLVENSSDPDPESWVQRWTTWLSELGFKEIPEEDETSRQNIADWADKVVQKFSKKYDLFEKTKTKLFNDEELK